MQKRSWVKAEANRQLVRELASQGHNIYSTLYRWIKSGKIDQKAFVRIMKWIEMNGVDMVEQLGQEESNE